MTAMTAQSCAIPHDLNNLSRTALWELVRGLFPQKRQLAAQTLFHRILSNWRRASYVDRYGIRWLVKTADELVEGLNLAKRSVYKLLRRFEEMGLIVKRHAPHIYAYEKGRDHCTWIAVRFPGAGGHQDQRNLPENLQEVKGLQTFGVKSGEVHLKGTSDLNGASSANQLLSKKNPSDKNISSADAEQEMPSFGEKISVPKSVKKAPTLAEIMAHRKARPPKPKAQVLKAQEALRIFQNARREAWPNEPPMPGTRKDIAFLKTFLAKMRAASFTDDEIRAVLSDVIFRWADFKGQVLRRTGRKLPDRPQVITFVYQVDEVQLFSRDASLSPSAAEGESLTSGMKTLDEMLKE